MARGVDTSDGPGEIPPRWRVSRFGELDSTNRWALDRAREGAAEGLVVVADHQTAGRGRLDRTWEAPPGSSLLVSVLLHRPSPVAPGGPDPAHRAVIAAAVALARAVRSVAGVDAGMKWPNDVVVDDRKLAGILAEAEGDALVVGLGVNVNWDAFPAELAATATACNLEAGHAVDRDALLAAFLTELAAALDDPIATERAHRDLLVTLGRRVRVTLTRGDPIEGEAVGLGVHGELEVRTGEGVIHAVTTGDVVHLRPA
jgi:BirA family transcriptional regulator, biotin operon repressor / biotin---[acetyl-CoA-carboxylase] ligase